MAVVKEGPDVAIFTHPSALTKLALWVGEAIREQEYELGKKLQGGAGLPLVVAALNEWRGVYVIVGTGTGANASSSSAKSKAKKLAKKAKKQEEKSQRKDEKKKQQKTKKKKKVKKKDKTMIIRSTIGHDTQAIGFAEVDPVDDDDDDDDDDEDGETEDDTEEEEEEEEDSDDSDSDDDSDDDEAQRAVLGRNRFGKAFEEVSSETAARVRIDSFEACVVEVRKEDLGTFLESLSLKTVVG